MGHDADEFLSFRDSPASNGSPSSLEEVTPESVNKSEDSSVTETEADAPSWSDSATIDPRRLVNKIHSKTGWRDLHNVLCDSVGLEGLQHGMDMVCKQRQKFAQGITGSWHHDIPNLSKSFQDLLVKTYFRHFHPLCPAISEPSFLDWYHNRHEKPSSLPDEMLLYAVFFGAFGHIDDHQLGGSPFSSVAEGQKRMFSIARNLFHLHAETKKSTVLVQTALLLSYWSPYDLTTEVNAYWVDQATHHAINGGIFSTHSTKHKRIILWCCLVRNRTIALGLRRPQLLYKLDAGHLPELGDYAEDFSDGLIRERRTKVCEMTSFILLCKLSEIMAAIIESRTKIHWVNWWQDSEDAAQVAGFCEVTTLEDRLDRWSREYDKLCRDTEDFWVRSDKCGYLHFLRILYLGTRISLWEERLVSWRSSRSATRSLAELALFKIRELSCEIAESVQLTSDNVGLEVMPSHILAWLIVPIAIHLLQARTKSRTDLEQNRRLVSMMNAVDKLKHRSQGATFVAKIVHHIYDNYCVNQIRTLPSHCSRSRNFLDNGAEAEDGETVTDVLHVIQDALSKGPVV